MREADISRKDYAAKFEHLFADYNTGGKDIDPFFIGLISLTRSLSEEELAIFDLLTRPTSNLTRKEREQVKQVA